MSHAIGAVIFRDGLIRWYDYNGTVDVPVSNLVETPGEVKFRQMPWLDCSCGQAEPVLMWSDYGGGFSWQGAACRHCRAIIHVSEDQFYETRSDGIPEEIAAALHA